MLFYLINVSKMAAGVVCSVGLRKGSIIRITDWNPLKRVCSMMHGSILFEKTRTPVSVKLSRVSRNIVE